MKRCLFITLSMLLGIVANAEGVATWLQTSHDFGTFKEETGKVSCSIKMVNTGDSDIRISRVQPTCGCTASSYTLGAIVPGDTASVTLTYDPKGRPGKFDKDVYVYTDGSPKKSIITIKGNVIGSPATIQERYPISAGGLKLSRRIIPFGEIIKGKSRTQFINVYNQSEDSLTAHFSNLPSYIEAEMVPHIVKPGEQATLTVTLHTQSCKEWGLAQERFTMETLPAGNVSKNATAGITNIDITAILSENFSRLSEKERTNKPIAALSTEKVDFGEINKWEGKANSYFEISNRGKSKLKIRRIYTLDEGVGIAFKKDEIKPGKSMKIKLSVLPEKFSKLINAKVIVITNDPDNPQHTVRLVGLLTDK